MASLLDFVITADRIEYTHVYEFLQRPTAHMHGAYGVGFHHQHLPEEALGYLSDAIGQANARTEGDPARGIIIAKSTFRPQVIIKDGADPVILSIVLTDAALLNISKDRLLRGVPARLLCSIYPVHVGDSRVRRGSMKFHLALRAIEVDPIAMRENLNKIVETVREDFKACEWEEFE
ncbi:hypothetical protein WKW50_16270 [Ochrobactrum sp. GPK 3]